MKLIKFYILQTFVCKKVSDRPRDDRGWGAIELFTSYGFIIGGYRKDEVKNLGGSSCIVYVFNIHVQFPSHFFFQEWFC